MSKQLEVAAERLRRAIEVKGPWPELHDQVVRETYLKWPSLARAVESVIEALNNLEKGRK